MPQFLLYVKHRMKDQRDFVPVSLAIVVGAALWLTTVELSGKSEAWDSAIYWELAYPLALLTCALLGRAYPKRSWRWALVLFEAQLVAMCLRNGEFGSLLPLGVVLFAILALPGMLVAMFTARLSRKSTDEAV
ncbi:MAG: hypothetical protein WCL27_10945 [Betaproteobacteria bacterium]